MSRNDIKGSITVAKQKEKAKGYLVHSGYQKKYDRPVMKKIRYSKDVDALLIELSEDAIAYAEVQLTADLVVDEVQP
ncbi:MAG: DUF2283 domain-containing protein [Coleofasciculus sp. D1-CHI-01]